MNKTVVFLPVGILLGFLLGLGVFYESGKSDQDFIKNFDILSRYLNVSQTLDETRKNIWNEINPNLDNVTFNIVSGYTYHSYNLSRIMINLYNLSFSIAYLIRHNDSTDNVNTIIYHQGHRGSPLVHGNNSILKLIDKNHQIVAFEMPLRGENGNFWDNTTFLTHTQILRKYKTHGLSFFVAPVLKMVEYFHQFGDVSMTGISGGGWTTVLVSAMTPLIKTSFSVAGSLPINIPSKNLDHRDQFTDINGDDDEPNNNDWEQNYRDFYSKYTYYHLYILMSYPSNRMSVLLYNDPDECCFSGNQYSTYDQQLKIIERILGASETIFVTDKTGGGKHDISDYALNLFKSMLS